MRLRQNHEESGRSHLEQAVEADYYCADLRDFVSEILMDRTGERK